MLSVEEPDIHSRASSAVRPVTTKPRLFCLLYTLYMPLIFTPMYMYSFKGLFTSVPSVCFRYVSRNSRSQCRKMNVGCSGVGRGLEQVDTCGVHLFVLGHGTRTVGREAEIRRMGRVGRIGRGARRPVGGR